jgi:CxxC-x17-CxxC domain-containing protein
MLGPNLQFGIVLRIDSAARAGEEWRHFAGRTGASHMEFQDRLLKCIDCGSEFTFTAGEQLFFYDKQFKNEPKRCKPCKTKRAAAVGAAPSNNYQKVETRTTCSHCGKETTVPFKPTQGRPVFCRECFQSRRTVAASA